MGADDDHGEVRKMIRVMYNEGEYCISIKGHAGANEPGKDIVCAGVSGICEALVGIAIDRRGRVVPAISRSAEGGSLRVKLYPDKERGKALARLMLDMAYTGMERIETQHPQYVRCSKTEEEI